jgi:hypothetical protein
LIVVSDVERYVGHLGELWREIRRQLLGGNCCR